MYVEFQGEKVPAVGYGTYQITHKGLVGLVEQALEVGYRHIDTAQVYDNEQYVGEGIEQSSVAREDIFLTTKIWVDQFRHDDLLISLRESLQKLKTDYANLVLLHWPNDSIPLEESLNALNEAKSMGMTRHIGVSNFTAAQVEQAVDLSEAPIMMNQIEYHPFLNQDNMLDTCKRLGVMVTGYCSLARGEVIGNPTMKKVADTYGKTEVQVAIRWLVEQRVFAIPKTEHISRLEENFDVMDFELTSDEIREIAELAHPGGRLVDPSFAPTWD